MRRCRNLVSGEVCDFFVYDVDVIPDWFVGYGVIGFGYYVNDNCGGIRMFNTSDRFASFYEDVSELKDISTYTSVDSPPPTEDILEKGREHVEAFNNRMDELKYTGICQDKESRGYYIYKVDGSSFCVYREKECYFTREFFHEIFYVIKEPNVDASFVGDTLEHVGRKCKDLKTECVHNFFVHWQDNIPEWFDVSKVTNSVKKWLLNSIDPLYIVDHISDMDDCLVMYKEDFDKSYKELFSKVEYISIERKEGATCPVGGCVDKSAAARFCRCRNDHSVVHEYFIYGTDVTPKWFKKIYIGCIGGYNFVTHNYILRRKSDGKISIITNEDFNKNLEVVDKLVLTDMYGKKNENYIGKISEEEMESVSVNYLCTDDGYTVKIDAAKYATDRMINSVTNDTSKRPEKIVVNDGVAAGTKVHTDNWQEGLDEYVKKSDVSDIDRAEQWFNNLHPEVFKYIVLRDLNIDEMVRIYKKEISNL